MAQGLTPESLAQIHELTYTLKDALEKINEEMDGLTDTPRKSISPPRHRTPPRLSATATNTSRPRAR